MEGTKKQLYFRLLSFFMALILCISSTNFVFAKDSLEHWADKYIKTLAEQHVYKSMVESYDAKSTITYEEFIEMAAKLFHYDKVSQIQSQTITLQDWFAKNITDIAVEKSDQTLTRQDAVVILAKMLKYDLYDSEKSKFKDDNKIADYARSSINTLAKKGHLNGYLDGTLKPENPISFGEASSLLCSVAGSVYSEGTHDFNNQTIQGNLSIVSPDVVLKNAVIEGDLYISEGVGTGEVTLNHVVVKGETIVSGGGVNSILFIDTQLGSLRVEVPDNVPVRVVASGNTNINMTKVHSESKLQTDTLSGKGFEGIVVAIPDNARVSLEGTFPSVIVDSPKAKVDILGGKAENVVITEKAVEAKINIASTATIASMEINAQATVGGTGTLESVSIASENVSIAQNPDIIDIKDGITSEINNRSFSTGTYSNHSGSSSSSRRPGSSSGSGTTPPGSGDDSSSGEDIGNGGNYQPEDKKELSYTYVEVSQTEENIFVDMFFEEPIEFLVNGKPVSDLNNLFTYQNENENGTIEKASLSETYLSFRIPKKEKASNYQISLEGNNWTLKGKNSKREFLSNPFLKFTISDAFPFVVNGPDDTTVFAGEKAVFKADVETSEKLYYQWYRNDTEIAGATENIYSFITGLSDSGNKFSVKIWFNHPDNIREIIANNTAVLTVESKQNATVILEEGSEGTAGDGCITDLQVGYRYYIIVYKDGKSYPVMKDGTLGSEDTEILYKNLQPLETTVISNLTNEEKYRVVKVLPDTPILQSLSISGFTNTVNFLGYVPKTIDGEIALSASYINLKAIADIENALITVSYRFGENGEEQLAGVSDDSYIIYLDDASTVEITITVSPQVETENQSVYQIHASRAAGIIVTRPGFWEEETDIVDIYGKSNLAYHIKYMKPTEKLDGIICKKNETMITLQETEHYTKEILSNGVTSIQFTKAFTDTLATDDILEFTFQFSGGTVREKICKAKIHPLDYNIGNFGTPELVSGEGWLNIFIPVTKENGEPIDDNIKNIIPYVNIQLYKDDTYYSDFGFSNPEFYEKDGKTGILVNCKLQISSDFMQVVPNKYKIEINYYKTSDDTSNIEYYPSDFYTIPEGEAINGEVVFHKSDNPSISLAPSKVSENRYSLNLTKENTPFYHEFQTEGTENIFSEYLELGHTTMTDDNGQSIDLYMASETEPELVYLFARMNCAPQLLLYDYEGEATIDGDFITNHSFYIPSYGDLNYGFYFYYTIGSQYFNTVKELKERHLNLEDIHLRIGTKEDGTPLEKTMQEFLDAGHFNGTSEETDITNLWFGNVKELFTAFGVNPLKDTLNKQVTNHAELNGIATFQLSDATYEFQDNNGALTKIVIKDKNGDRSMVCDVDQAEIVIPYTEAAIETTSTGDYECVIYDEDAIPINNKGLILTPGVSTPVAIVIAKGGMLPKVYKFNLTYEPETASEISTFSLFRKKAEISFVQITDDMSEKEIEDIVEPSEEVANKPSEEVANKPSEEVSNKPSEEVADKPSEEVADKPSEEVADEPSEEVSDEPSEEVADEPSEEVADEPSEEIADEPSEEVTDEPSEEVTDEPSEEVTDEPSEEIADEPSEEVTDEPSEEVSDEPSEEVSDEPSEEVTDELSEK